VRVCVRRAIEALLCECCAADAVAEGVPACTCRSGGYAIMRASRAATGDTVSSYHDRKCEHNISTRAANHLPREHFFDQTGAQKLAHGKYAMWELYTPVSCITFRGGIVCIVGTRGAVVRCGSGAIDVDTCRDVNATRGQRVRLECTDTGIVALPDTWHIHTYALER